MRPLGAAGPAQLEGDRRRLAAAAEPAGVGVATAFVLFEQAPRALAVALVLLDQPRVGVRGQLAARAPYRRADDDHLDIVCGEIGSQDFGFDRIGRGIQRLNAVLY